MATLSQILADTRALLDDPIEQHPSQRHLLTLATAHIQAYVNQLSNSGQNWTLASWVLSVGPDVDEYLITAADFGKPLYILSEDITANFLPREIRIADPQNFDHFQTPRYSWLTDKHSAQAIGFYGKTGTANNFYAKVTPVPKMAADYRIWYQPGPHQTGGLGEQLILPEHHHLLTNRIAQAALPYSRWEGMDAAGNTDHRAQLGNALGAQAAIFEDQFSRYITNMRREQMGDRLPFGHAEELDGWYM